MVIMDVSPALIYKKIDEYIMWLEKTKLVTDKDKLTNFKNQLHSLNIKRMHNAPGDARIDYDNLYYCPENIIGQVMKKGLYYIDEVFFHEFSHLLNTFHNSLIGPNSFSISKSLESKMDNFTTRELLVESDPLLYNQDPCFGVVLLDEFFAQTVAQRLVQNKYDSLDLRDKRNYAFKGLKDYDLSNYKTIISEPPITLPTSLSDYPEFDLCAKNFIVKYNLGSVNKFISDSVNLEHLKNIINNQNEESAKEMYIDLCYLGLIEEAVSISLGHKTEDNPKDPVNDPKNVYKAFKRILKKDR